MYRTLYVRVVCAGGGSGRPEHPTWGYITLHLFQTFHYTPLLCGIICLNQFSRVEGPSPLAPCSGQPQSLQCVHSVLRANCPAQTEGEEWHWAHSSCHWRAVEHHAHSSPSQRPLQPQSLAETWALLRRGDVGSTEAGWGEAVDRSWPAGLQWLYRLYSKWVF